MEAVKDYTVHIDSKKRVTLRGAMYSYYNVREYANGCIMLEPRELLAPETISIVQRSFYRARKLG